MIEGQGLMCGEEVPCPGGQVSYLHDESFRRKSNSQPNINRPAVKANPPIIMGGNLASGTALLPFAVNFSK